MRKSRYGGMFTMKSLTLLLLAEGLHAQPTTSELPTRTVTITTTSFSTGSPTNSIDSIPTMFGKQDVNAFDGCFEQSASDSNGKALGYDYIIPADASDFDNLTASLCVSLCMTARTTSGGTYAFAGVTDGRDCYCGTTISPNTHKVPDENCSVACPGDSTQSCGGKGYMAIYSVETSHTTHHTGDSPNRQASPTPSNESPTFYAAENAQDNQPSKAPTGPTVAVIVSSVSGFVLLCVLIFIGVKLHRRNNQLKAAGHRRVESRPEAPKLEAEGEATERGKSVTFKKRHSIITSGNFSPTKTTTQGPNVTRMLGMSAKAGETGVKGDAATTSVEWRLDDSAIKGSGLSPRLPSARENNTMTLPIHREPDTVAQVPGLGDRAWRRRRYSLPLPPKAAKGAVGKERSTPAQGGSSDQPSSRLYVQEGDVPTLPVLDFDTHASGDPGTAPKDDPEPSPPFTLWTLPSTPSLPHFDRVGENADRKPGER